MFASPVTLTSSIDITRSCSVTITLILPSALTEYVPRVRPNWEPVTDTIAFPTGVSSPIDIVSWDPVTLTIVFTSIVVLPWVIFNCCPIKLMFAFAVTVDAPIDAFNSIPVTATLALAPPSEAMGDWDKVVIPNTVTYLALAGTLLLPTKGAAANTM